MLILSREVIFPIVSRLDPERVDVSSNRQSPAWRNRAYREACEVNKAIREFADRAEPNAIAATRLLLDKSVAGPGREFYLVKVIAELSLFSGYNGFITFHKNARATRMQARRKRATHVICVRDRPGLYSIN